MKIYEEKRNSIILQSWSSLLIIHFYYPFLRFLFFNVYCFKTKKNGNLFSTNFHYNWRNKKDKIIWLYNWKCWWFGFFFVSTFISSVFFYFRLNCTNLRVTDDGLGKETNFLLFCFQFSFFFLLNTSIHLSIHLKFAHHPQKKN